MGLGGLRELVMDRDAWHAAVHRGCRVDWATELNWRDKHFHFSLSPIFWDRPNFYPIIRQHVRHHVISFYLENDLMERWPSSYGQNHTPRARTGQWYGEHYHSLLKLTLYPDDINEIFSLTLHRSWQIRTVFNIPTYLFNPIISTRRPECQELYELLGPQRDRTGLQWGILLFKVGSWFEMEACELPETT